MPDSTDNINSEEMIAMMRAVYNEAIMNLVKAFCPITLTIKISDLTGLPPSDQNQLATIAGDRERVKLVITYCETVETGVYYHGLLLDESDIQISAGADADLVIRDWHLVHYLQRASITK